MSRPLNDNSDEAFPTIEHGYAGGEPSVDTHYGMSLRDYFAAKAMQGLVASDTTDSLTISTIAKCAYEQADAMIKAREA